MKLHTYFRSSASYRVRIALQLKSLPYESVPVHLVRGEQKSQAYAAHVGDTLVPALVTDEGHWLTQSMAIIEYLDETHAETPLLPGDALGRAHVRALAQMVACEIHPLNNLRVLGRLKSQFGADDAAVAEWYRHWIVEGFTALEAMAPETGLFGGAHPNLADVCLVPQMANARRFETPLEAFPKLVRIDAALREMEAFAKAAPEAVKPE